MAFNYSVQDRQTQFDICLQYYGTIEAIKWLMEDNTNIMSSVDIESVVSIRNAAADKYIVQKYAGYVPVSGGAIDEIVLITAFDTDPNVLAEEKFLFDENEEVIINQF